MKQKKTKKLKGFLGGFNYRKWLLKKYRKGEFTELMIQNFYEQNSQSILKVESEAQGFFLEYMSLNQ